MIRIIDSKKVDLTDSEFQLYNEICEAYNTAHFKGANLFKDLFETNKDGIIIFIKPSNKTNASMEAYLFVIAVMVHQHLRLSAAETDSMVAEMKKELEELKILKEELKKKLEEI